MPTRFLSDAELVQLSGYPAEIADDDLVTFFLLGRSDVAWLRRQHRGAANRLGLALQLCTLPWLGFVPDDLTRAPAAAVERLAAQLDLEGRVLGDYGGWKDRTRTDHLRQVLTRLGWRTPERGDLKALGDFLVARALEHDSPTVLLALACDYLRSERLVRPTPDRLSRWIGTARNRAWTETAARLAPLLPPARRRELDGLLDVDPGVGMSRLAWLRRGATSATPEVIKVEIAKLEYLRAAGVEGVDRAGLPAGRWRHLALLGRRSTAQAIGRMDSQRRHPILLATVAESAVEILDELIQLFDQALAGTDSRARHELDERLLASARDHEDRDELLDEVLEVLLDPDVADVAVGHRLRQGLGMDRLQAARRPPEERVTRALGHFQLLEARYNYLRTFAPEVLAAMTFAGGHGATSLLQAVEVLRQLNATGGRRLPDDVPVDFVPARWRSRLETAKGESERGAAHRHYWEVAVLYGLQTALRSGDVWVPGSRRYADPATYLIAKDSWPGLRDEFCQLTGTPADPQVRLTQLEADLHAALSALEPVLAAGDGIARLDEDGDLVVTPLPAETLSADTIWLKNAAAERLPHVDLASLLIEVDGLCGFTDHLTHAGGATSRAGHLRRNLYAALLAQATNLGYAGMADAAGISEDALAWTTQWYLREATLRAANTALVNYHHRLPLARLWGGGTLSSSDGQRFPQRGKSTTARALSRYFLDEGTTTYTHVADQHATYGTKVIPSTVRDATYVLDEILGNPTELPIAEHATDTAGQTFAVFAACDLLGLRFYPRIRDLPSRRLYRLGPAKTLAAWPKAGKLLTQPIQTRLITSSWDELLRLGGSLKFGHATASLLLGRLQAGARQNTLAKALVEYGRLVRTVFLLRYLADDELRRRIHRQLNKGENLHALRRRIFFAFEGHVRRRHHHEQTEQALCLTLVTNAVIVFNTVYLQGVLETLAKEGHTVNDRAAAHLSPALLDHINPYGSYTFDVERELHRTGRRPLRPVRPSP